MYRYACLFILLLRDEMIDFKNAKLFKFSMSKRVKNNTRCMLILVLLKFVLVDSDVR